MNVLGLIPARWSSTRFPGKPLVDIGGKSMIQRVYEQSSKALEYVVVATDDERIVQEVNRFGGQVVMTRADHKSGTDRCAEALDIFESQHSLLFDIAINIQGDEPFIQVQQIIDVVKCFDDPSAQIATIIKKITDMDALFNPNNPKVILNYNKEAIYFSRSTIPYVVNNNTDDWMNRVTFYEHLGLYAYKTDVLRQITKLEPSILEIAESLEQNRWLENGFKIKVAETEFENISIDTLEDLNKILKQGGF
jgi:3-deoxy-manno-octulosonate cytidylyltransferase (CMP-KDO synthetase)